MEMTLLDAAIRMAAAEIAIRVNAHEALERVAVKVEATAKAEIGEYQDAIGPFQNWAELADSTKEDRVRKGYTENDPLLRSGELRNSIGHETSDLETVIGSTSDIMVYQEFGTSRIPPRPVMGPAAERNRDYILAELGGAVVAGLLGTGRIHPSLGYDQTID